MRLSYLGQDRADVQEASKCLSQRMKHPTEFDLSELKRAARYLKQYPRAVLVFSEQSRPHHVDAWVDSDHAGDIITRKSTSGLVIMHGQHCLKSSSTIQDPISLSSGESEYYACVKGGCYVLGVKSLMQEWGLNLPLMLKVRTDSSAAKGFCSRRGLGKMRHVSTRYLWLQDRVAKSDLHILKVRTHEQLADFLTKALGSRAMLELVAQIGLQFRGGRAASQKGALLCGAEQCGAV